MSTKSQIADSIRDQFAAVGADQIEKHPMMGPGNRPTPFFTMWTTRNGELRDQVGGAVKEGYVPHTLDDVCVLGEVAAEAFGCADNCDVTCWWSGSGHEILVQPRREFFRTIANPKDIVWPRLHVKAGYDGTAYRASLGVHRHMCNNLMFPRCIGGVSASIFHTTNLRTRIDALAEQFQDLASHWDEMNDIFETMAAKIVPFEEFVTKVFGLGLKSNGSDLTAIAQRRTEALMTRLMREREELNMNRHLGNTQVSVWEAMNVVQGYLQHEQNRRGNFDSIDRIFVSIDDQRINKAYELALHLATAV